MSMITKNFIFSLILLPLALSATAPFGLGQNSKQPNFAMPDKKGKKGPHKNPFLKKSLEELKKELSQALADKDYETAAKYLDAMRMVCTDTEELKNILLQLADLYYRQEDWAKAERVYSEFVMLYPGAAKCDYAHYRAVACGFKLTLTPDRDQTKTQEVLKLADEFIGQFKTSDYLDQITTVATQCREKLFESDTNVFTFYFNSKNYKAAQKRLDTLCKEHVPHLPAAEPKTLELTIQLAQAQNNSQSLLEAQFKLVSQFPASDVTKQLVASPEEVKLAWENRYTITT